MQRYVLVVVVGWCAVGRALQIERRAALAGLGGGAASLALTPAAQAAAATAALKNVKWTATDGFDSDFPSQIDFIEFDEKAYKAMRDDPRRTPKFARAIRNRLAELEDAVVLDLGTGPYCVLALIAATAGAKKVYAVEANPEAARRAKAFIAKCERPGASGRDGDGVVPLAPGLVEVVEGFSTKLDLPEKVDLCVFEICGSVASEEGVYATMRDARARHVKRPDDPATYIPRRCQTYAAPVSYALHTLLTPPSYDWSKIAGGAPIRFNCRDDALQLLAPPTLLEDVDFTASLPPLPTTLKADLSFAVDAARVAAAERNYAAAFADEKQLRSLLVAEDGGTLDAAATAAACASALSGLAMWPTLVLDDDPKTLVRSRGPAGEAQKSHWQTVLQLLTDAPIAVAPGDTVDVHYEARPEADVTKATTYALSGSLARAA